MFQAAALLQPKNHKMKIKNIGTNQYVVGKVNMESKLMLIEDLQLYRLKNRIPKKSKNIKTFLKMNIL